jgi:hypothetical protein
MRLKSTAGCQISSLIFEKKLWRGVSKLEVCSAHARKCILSLYFTMVVVQNVPLLMTRSSMANGCDVTESDVTGSDATGIRRCTSGHAQNRLQAMTSIPVTWFHVTSFPVRALPVTSLPVTPYVKSLSSSLVWFYLFEVFCSTPRVFSITFAFSLWYFY